MISLKISHILPEFSWRFISSGLISTFDKKLFIRARDTYEFMIPAMTIGRTTRGNLTISNSDKLTNTVCGSRVLFGSIRTYVVNEAALTKNEADSLKWQFLDVSSYLSRALLS